MHLHALHHRAIAGFNDFDRGILLHVQDPIEIATVFHTGIIGNPALTEGELLGKKRKWSPDYVKKWGRAVSRGSAGRSRPAW